MEFLFSAFIQWNPVTFLSPLELKSAFPSNAVDSCHFDTLVTFLDESIDGIGFSDPENVYFYLKYDYTVFHGLI